jgi:PBP1b-binding outer membrane lipoprotein LpoB
MDRRLKIGVICSLAVILSGCIPSNPTSEVMVDTNAKTKKALPGAPPNVVPADDQ